MDAKNVVLAFWKSMESNDFSAASQWLADDYEAIWPLSSERIVGCDNFIAINTEYPANGHWHFKINRIVCEGNQVVTDITVTDGTRTDTAVTFHTIENNKITRQVEYWPENYEAPAWRKKWTETLEQK
ncbi:polyketide cyclase [Veronia nyctiphanis]|uniref:Polyketide cyclase n=1 Tax=Veronia nyctiphanis TaxID=1278244 RepID=A0A4Q0YTQ5_9GAMM|nr:nuclear transport factor 2 family protein [Veronia nyctiphanis]RXJ74636.1 polyketide cyclase [Veronia nyctiphanis]